MSLVCGIDEAGYGPHLGPLVVTAAVFEAASREAVRKALSSTAADSVARACGRPVVCDSKVLYRGRYRLRRLERNLLPFVLVCAGDYRRFFREPCGECHGSGVDHLWYRAESVELPRCGDAEGIARDAENLRSALAERGVALSALRFRALDVAKFNDAVCACGNKAVVLFGIAAELLCQLWAQAERTDVEVWVDKHGGRNRYAPALVSIFDGAWVGTLEEGQHSSVYEVRQGSRRMVVRFVSRGEERHKAVALASMCSKYVRELFMARFNAYWTRRVPGLAPTQGYGRDAARFVRQIADSCRRDGIRREMVVRLR